MATQLIELELKGMSTIVGHFVSSPRERVKRDRKIAEEVKERDREEWETGMKVKIQKKLDSAQWGTYTPDQSYRHFLKSTKYLALTLEMVVACYML